MTTTTTNSAANEATEAGGLSVETLIICIILLIVSLLVSAVICFILRRGLRHIHEESEAPQQMEEWSVTPKEDDLEAGAQMNVVGWQDWSKTPEVWDPTALSQYVASIQGLVQSCFQEGAAGVRLIGIKPWAVDFELWEWLELHEHLRSSLTTELGDVVLSEVVFESLGEELKAATAEGGFAILVYMGQEDFASALRLAARNASQNVSACAVKIVESGVMGI
ncbi:unnamed protein product [Durusdinium trenchii]|uniref:Uncharacterized protein n=1 Tax=Durusdinium trenchii TaxID=1381693 RepID=A0ABP0L1R5_9DINO